MNAPKPDAQPGWRVPHWRSQEEAEAAGLVAVVAATEVPNHPPGWYRGLLPELASKWFYFPPAEKGAVHTAWDGSRWEFDMLGGGAWDLSHYAPGSDGDRTVPAAPAPLDPGNPEHLRQVADAVVDFPLPQWEDATEEKLEQDAETAQEFARFWRAEADRIEREAAEQAREAEQDAADRKRADEFIAAATPGSSYTPDHLRYAYLTGIRAERARKEAEQ